MLNKAVLMGRLTRDPELKHTQNGTSVTSFTLAVNRTYSRSAEQQPQTDFIDIVAWEKTAEFVSKYFRKGMLVAVSGRIQTRNWEDKQGNKRVSVEVVAEEVHFAEPKKDQPSRAAETATGAQIPSAGSDFSELSDEDGELPF